MKWINALVDPPYEGGEVLLFSRGHVQSASVSLRMFGLKQYWETVKSDLTDPFPLREGDFWIYLDNVTPPDIKGTS